MLITLRPSIYFGNVEIKNIEKKYWYWNSDESKLEKKSKEDTETTFLVFVLLILHPSIHAYIHTHSVDLRQFVTHYDCFEQTGKVGHWIRANWSYTWGTLQYNFARGYIFYIFCALLITGINLIHYHRTTLALDSETAIRGVLRTPFLEISQNSL